MLSGFLRISNLARRAACCCRTRRARPGAGRRPAARAAGLPRALPGREDPRRPPWGRRRWTRRCSSRRWPARAQTLGGGGGARICRKLHPLRLLGWTLHATKSKSCLLRWERRYVCEPCVAHARARGACGACRKINGSATCCRKRRAEELSSAANGGAELDPGAAEPGAAQPPAEGLTLGERLAALQLQAGAAVRPRCFHSTM